MALNKVTNIDQVYKITQDFLFLLHVYSSPNSTLTSQNITFYLGHSYVSTQPLFICTDSICFTPSTDFIGIQLARLLFF